MAEFVCYTCGSTSVVKSDLGQYICADCGTQSQDIMEEAAEDGATKTGMFTRTLDSHVERHATQDAEEAILTAQEAAAGGKVVENPETATAAAYVEGAQHILQGILEVLVRRFGCSEELLGVGGEIWLSLVQHSEVLSDGLEQEAAASKPSKGSDEWLEMLDDAAGLDEIDPSIDEEEEGQEDADAEPLSTQEEGQEKKYRKRRARKVLKKRKQKAAPTELGPGQQWQRVFSLLERRIPNEVLLAIPYLACFWLREPVLPTDIVRWTLEGHLPYLARSVTLPPHIESRLRGLALKPRSIPSPRHIEFRAGVIAERLGLELPPINAHLVAARLLKDLGLPDSLVVLVDRLLELVKPRGFWISAAKRAVPPRTFVAAIIVVTVKLAHQLGGPIASTQKGREHQLSPLPEVLQNLTPPSRGLKMPSPAPPLITRPGEPVDLQNLDRYLRYCKDVIFKGAEPAADLKEYHTACEKFFQGAVEAEAAQPRSPPADVAGTERENCEIGVLKPMSDMDAPVEYEIVHYTGPSHRPGGHKDYVRLLRSAAAAIWVTPMGLHKVVKEVELDLFEVERSLQTHLQSLPRGRLGGEEG